MSTTGVPQDNSGWGGQTLPARRWTRRETALAVLIAAVIAALGGAVIYAATGHSSSPFAVPPGVHGPMSGGGPPSGPGAAMGPAVPATRGGHSGPPLHGQVVVGDGAGGYVTVLSQTGVVTAVTPESVTVRSLDGYTQVWAVGSGQRRAFAADDSVMIRGEQAVGAPTPTITEVLDPLVTPR